MIRVYADLHVHTGRAGGRPVKITASAKLTVRRALAEAVLAKGMGVVALIDAAATPVREELVRMVGEGELAELAGGGLAWTGAGERRPLVVPGCEVEISVAGRPVHLLVLLPSLAATEAFAAGLAQHVRNPTLGAQRAHGLDLPGLRALAQRVGGLVGLAHAFTPHRGWYGSTRATVAELTGRPAGELIDFVEMGLSADTAMADAVAELRDIPLVSASDAHGPDAIAREATLLELSGLDFAALSAALGAAVGRAGGAEGRILATYGLDPALGKYHRTACARCGWLAGAAEPLALACRACGEERRVVAGVLDRVLDLAGLAAPPDPAPSRPPYRYHVPLRFLPGIGPATSRRLLARFGGELAVLHEVPRAELAAELGAPLAELILAARARRLPLAAGGGGRFGRVAGGGHISTDPRA